MSRASEKELRILYPSEASSDSALVHVFIVLCMVLLILVFLVAAARLVIYFYTASGGLLFNHPIENEIVLIADSVKEILEELPQVTQVGLLLKLQRSAVVHIDGELLWEAFTKGLDGG